MTGAESPVKIVGEQPEATIEPCGRIERLVPGIGTLTVKPFCLRAHVVPAHAWLSSSHAAFWGMRAFSHTDVVDYFKRIENSTTHNAMIGLHNGEPAFLIETYDPAAEPVGRHYAIQPGDRGMHLLVAPPTQKIALFTWAVFALTVDSIFADPRQLRIVVEPDVDNEAIHVLNERAGFVYGPQLALPGKTGWLAFCTRTDHDNAMRGLGQAHARAAGRSASLEPYHE